MTQQRSSSTTLERTAVSFAAPLSEPIQLIRTDTGQPCKAHLFGDVAGMSPAYLVVDEQGNSDWVSIANTKVVDPKYLSSSRQALKIASEFTR